jgi:hypothetical protein
METSSFPEWLKYVLWKGLEVSPISAMGAPNFFFPWKVPRIKNGLETLS